MAVANLVSRITGFLRQVVLVGVLGVGVLNDAYTVSNTLPNIVYELLFGGVLTSVMVPLLVRAQKEDADGGETYIRRLITLTGVALAVRHRARACSPRPLLTRLYLGGQSATANPELATALAYLLLPQILFYGLGALLGAILNTRGSFGAFAWAPVLNNVVVLVVLGVYALMPGEISLDPVRMGEPKLLVLGIGTTLGIVVQALVLLPALRRTGFVYRPRWGWDPRLSAAGGLVAVGDRLRAHRHPRLHGHHPRRGGGRPRRRHRVRERLAPAAGALRRARRLAAHRAHAADEPGGRRRAAARRRRRPQPRQQALRRLPGAAGRAAHGVRACRSAIALFGLRSGNLDGAARIGAAVACSAFGLLPYAITMLQLRVFYAMTDSRTPTLHPALHRRREDPAAAGVPAWCCRRARSCWGWPRPTASRSSRAPCSGRCCCGDG